MTFRLSIFAADGGDDGEDAEDEDDEDGQGDLQVDLLLRDSVGYLVLEVLPATGRRCRRVPAQLGPILINFLRP